MTATAGRPRSLAGRYSMPAFQPVLLMCQGLRCSARRPEVNRPSVTRCS
jgi:hypothetical protein